MNEQVADWIEVDESKYNEIKRSRSGFDNRSVTIEMTLSPYDVPNQVRGDYDDSTKRFVIDFKYIDAEDRRRVDLGEHVSASVGSRSGRIYSLFIDIDALGAEAVALKIVEDCVHDGANQALEKMASIYRGMAESQKPNTKNYSVAQRIIRDYWPHLKRDLVAAH